MFKIVVSFFVVIAALAVAISVTSFAAASSSSSSDIGPSQLFARNKTSLVTEITTLQHITDIVRDRFGTSVVAFYDSADLSSWRARDGIEGGASLLHGFARVFAADIRNPAVSMLASAWTVQTVPWIYGIGPRQHRLRTEEFAGAPNVASLGGGIRSPVPRSRQFNEVTAAEIRKFGLALVADADLVINRVETPSQFKTVQAELLAGGSTLPSVVLLTDKATSSLLYRALAASFQHRANFIEINTKKLPAAMKELGVKKLPTLFVVPAGSPGSDGSEKQKQQQQYYDGALNIEPLTDFVGKFVTLSREDVDAASRRENDAALQREIRRRESPLLEIRDAADWVAEVEQRAGVVGLVFYPPSSSETESSSPRAKAEAAVRELREKEAAKKIRSNVVQFVAMPLSDERFQRLAAAVARGGSDDPATAPALDAEALGQTQIHFVSARKGVVSKFIGAVSGDGLFGFMRADLTRGVGVKQTDVVQLKNVLN